MSEPYDVFLSHSSADKPAVEEVARKLRKEGIEPFLDKWHLIPGELWQPALEKGLRNSRACIIFVGSEGIGPWHRQEMLVALNRGAMDPDFRVIPVLLPGFKKPDDIPDFLFQRTWVEFPTLEDEDSFHRLVSGIRGEAWAGGGEAPAKDAHPYRCMAQPPEGWIHRQEYDDVLEALCSEQGAQAGRSVGITTGLRGAGGFGKTALAQKLCFDERVREVYPDGILWATMGEEADSNSRLKEILDLIRWWIGEEPPSFETVAAAGAKLRESLSKARVLVVVDDVWSLDDVAPFQGLGEGCGLLITTRDNRTLPAGSALIKVDAMASSEAVDLLRAGLPGSSPEQFIALAAHLGEWPLLLKLVNGPLREMVKGGLSISEALQEIEEALATEGFSAFDQNDSASRHAAASRAILVSIRRLPEAEREFFFQLAIFPEDEDVPVSALELYWGVSHFLANKICQHLYDLSLLLAFDRKSGAIRLHDVTRRVLVEQRVKELSSLHSRLLDVYRPASGRWEDLSDEKEYMYRRLRDHFIGAGQQSECKALLMNFIFIEARLNARDINFVLSDYEPFARADREVRFVRDALRLSAHVLATNKSQLAPQLLGRLWGRNEPNLCNLIAQAKSWRKRPWVRPRTGGLTQAGGALLRILEGHTDWVNTVAVVDDRRAISTSDDRTLRIWDLEKGLTLRTLEGHTSWVRALAVVDCRRAISASADGTLRVWDLEQGQTLRIIKLHSTGVSAVAILAGQRAISGDTNGTLRVWDLESGQSLQVLEGHRAGVNALAVVGEQYAISASTDRTLRVWDLNNGKVLRILEGHELGVSAVKVIDGWRVLSASADRTLRVWNLKSGQTLQILEGHAFGIKAVAMIDGWRAISASADRTLQVWDLEQGRLLQTIDGHTAGVNGVAVLNGQRAISASADKTLRLWDLEVGPTLQVLDRHRAKVSAVAVDSRYAVSASAGMLRVWDLKDGQSLQTLSRQGNASVIRSLAVLNGMRVVSVSDDSLLQVWDLQSKQALKVLGSKMYVRSLAILDAERIVSFSDHDVLVWDLVTGQHHQIFDWGRWSRVRSAAMLNRQLFVSISYEGTLDVWDLASGEISQSIKEQTAKAMNVAVVGFQRVVAACADKTIRIWDLMSGSVLTALTLDVPVCSVAATPDGKIIVAGDESGRVHFFDLVEPEP